MSESLNSILDKYIEYNKSDLKKELKTNNSEEEDRIFKLAKEQLKNNIYSEIEKELMDKVIKNAEPIIEENNRNKHISEIKKLTTEGVFLAVFVGILVNQLSNLITLLINPTQTARMTFFIVICSFILVFLLIWIFLFNQLSDILVKNSKRQ
ncbi:MAG: hypothetical protein J6T41_07210 [Neisseriaceae bacterium]|nr:hypothetical protein [Neisseriaceae bacterium]